MWQGLIAMILAGLFGLIAIACDVKGDEPIRVTVIPPMPQRAPRIPARIPEWQAEEIAYWGAVDALATAEADEEQEWAGFYVDSYCEHADAFTALFNSYETKRAKNGALMIRQGNSGSYRFAKKGK